MGLVRNLKKRLSNLADKILAEVSYHYMVQKARQTTKRPDNSSVTTSLRKDLTMEPQGTTIVTSSQGTSEKIIMELTTEEIVVGIREWTLNRMDNTNHENAQAIYEEFAEWIEIDSEKDIDIMSIENGEN
jgi:hypothetical protein